ncbi:MAG: PHP domain-containing protein [Anaerolineales bacterium]
MVDEPGDPLELSNFRAELHVHTVLSPCAGVEMIPPLIVRQALEAGINLIAITDHNASANVAAVQQAACSTPLTVLPGIELQTREEVHLLGLFPDLEALAEFQAEVDIRMPDIENTPDFFGEQFIVDETGDFLRREPRLLINSCQIDFDDAVTLIHDYRGLAIPAHIDRKSFGLFAQLGLVPIGVPLDAVEISRRLSPAEARKNYPDLRGLPLLQGGDVHHSGDFLGTNLFHMAAPSLAEIDLALRDSAGRGLQIVTGEADNLHKDV